MSCAASMHVQYPMLFKITNKREGKHSHCGVLEFVAQEGMCYMPQWVCDLSLVQHWHAAMCAAAADAAIARATCTINAMLAAGVDTLRRFSSAVALCFTGECEHLGTHV